MSADRSGDNEAANERVLHELALRAREQYVKLPTDPQSKIRLRVDEEVPYHLFISALEAIGTELLQVSEIQASTRILEKEGW